MRNQARVPLWYEGKFGVQFGAVSKASDGIDRFPCATTAIGIRKAHGRYEIYAPFGLDNLFSGVLVPNRALDIPEPYQIKTARWIRQWPHLRAICWQDSPR
ncbi:nucleotidyltransferase family protein [Paraburkholderia sp. 2C]